MFICRLIRVCGPLETRCFSVPNTLFKLLGLNQSCIRLAHVYQISLSILYKAFIHITLTAHTWVKIRGRCTGKWTWSSLQFYQMHRFIIVMHSQTWINLRVCWTCLWKCSNHCLAHTNFITKSITNKETDALIIFFLNAWCWFELHWAALPSSGLQKNILKYNRRHINVTLCLHHEKTKTTIGQSSDIMFAFCQ